jgi:hypothetical protein
MPVVLHPGVSFDFYGHTKLLYLSLPSTQYFNATSVKLFIEFAPGEVQN